MAKLIIAVVLAGWVAAIAILSVQNATPISLKFFGLQSIQIPFGVVLALFAAAGMVLAAIALGMLGELKRPSR
ncbi:hypothetical protein C7271_16110 [filamentous cyanobacterium CCP5]|nr:hypothetical protein C7271_16110 [filamentous cyanobacterium CCP5]